jgi:WD repeat-containing protein 23
MRNLYAALFELQTSGGGDASGSRRVTLEALQSLLNSNSAGSPEDDEDEYNDDEFGQTARDGDWNQQWFPPHKDPQEPGVELLMGGEFGYVGPKIRSRKNKKNISRLMFNQSSRPRGALYRESIIGVCHPLCISWNELNLLQDLIPNTSGTAVASYDSNVYCGQFSRGHHHSLPRSDHYLTSLYRFFVLLYMLSRYVVYCYCSCRTTIRTLLKISAFIFMT